MALIMVGTGSPGCFVFDEIDSGQEVMRKHSSEGKKGAGKGDSEGGSGLASLKQQGADRFGNLQERVEEALRPQPHPDDIVVRCEIDGRPQFMRKFSCQSLGGRVLSH